MLAGTLQITVQEKCEVYMKSGSGCGRRIPPFSILINMIDRYIIAVNGEN